MNYECPIKFNPSDYFIEVLAAKNAIKSNVERINVIFN
jgi:hypothetical protein